MTALLSYAFEGLVRARGAFYDRGWLAIERAGRPVISVGNIAVGGTGKTPFTILLAKKLTARGETVAVLSRGYGAKKTPRAPAIVTASSRAEEVGDEPILIAAKTKAHVIVAPRRIDAARLAVGELHATILLLDDGFQHRRLARDLDIVLLDAADPFRGGLMPKGRLREPPSALERANLIVLVGDASLPKPHLPDRPVLRVEVTAARELRGRRVALIAAIARPERFEATAKKRGAQIVYAKFFRDHRWFDPTPWIREARERGAELILTTEKDHARQPHAELEPLPIEHVIVEGEASLDRALEQVLQGRIPATTEGATRR